MPFHIVVMAGGSGTRFWPLSRRGKPKQALSLDGDRSLLAATLARVAPLDAKAWIACGEHLEAPLRAALGDAPEPGFILEPEPRNTTACIALSVARVLAATNDPETVLAFVPADHAIDPEDRFRSAMTVAAERARLGGRLVVLGIEPSRPATGFGYIELGAKLPDATSLAVHEVTSFHEKPDTATAQAWLAAGGYTWNGGFVIARADAILAELATHAPAIHSATEGLRAALVAGDVARAREVFTGIESISFDYAVLEKSSSVEVVRADFEWDDLGSFTALADRAAPDADGNATRVGAGLASLLHECRDTFVTGTGEHLVAALGVEGLVIVHTPDATLVCPKDRVEEVRKVVEELAKNGREDLL